MRLKFVLCAFTTLLSIQMSNAQVTVGVYHGSFYSQLGIGSNPENKFFAEGRLFAGDILNSFFGIEGIGQYNFISSDWYNLSAGIMLGYNEYDEGQYGLHGMVSVKPIENHRNLAIIMEATPFRSFETFNLRANLGVRYTFGRNRE
ncbi:hypothetical protein [Anditalea andensis]|uniref:Outer membrane protein beta-barrel domain-containing protein n=1 Tax=Anditalea andensis TaxID=1048983 RepID=A0A074KTI7_9BACT|nr:hypothetical protein [Anditalea andensis]KEO73276.1 hypothetical protein EL17_13080 [Anditalea andensis]